MLATKHIKWQNNKGAFRWDMVGLCVEPKGTQNNRMCEHLPSEIPMYRYWYLCTYMYTYNVCIYLCTYECMHTCMHVCMYVCMHVCMYACMYVYMYACMHVFMYVSCGKQDLSWILNSCNGPSLPEQLFCKAQYIDIDM